jgi:hypothetical protein
MFVHVDVMWVIEYPSFGRLERSDYVTTPEQDDMGY